MNPLLRFFVFPTVLLSLLLSSCSFKDATTKFLEAASGGDLDQIEEFINKGMDVNVKEEDTLKTALMYASESGHLNLVKFLLDKKANAMDVDFEGNTALLFALKNDNRKIAQLLIDPTKENINLTNNSHQSAFWLAYEKNYLTILNDLLSKSYLSVVFNNDSKNSPLMMSIKTKKWEHVKLFIQHEKFLDKENTSKETPLHLLVQKNQLSLIKKILTKNIRLNVLDSSKKTPLYYAVERNREELVRVLVEHKAKLNLLQGKNRETVLQLAIRNKNVKLSRFLIEKGSEIESKNAFGQRAIHLAIQSQKADLVNLILEKGAKVDVVDNKGSTPLHLASRINFVEVLPTLVKLTQKINLVDSFGQTAIEYNVKNGHVLLVKELISKGAKVHLQDEQGNSLLMQSLLNGDQAMAELFIEEKVDLNSSNTRGEYPLFVLLHLESARLLKLFIGKGGDLSLVNIKGNTALHVSVLNKQEVFVEILLKTSININHQNKEGNTALHESIKEGLWEITDDLILKGVKLNIQNKRGKTPLMLAALSRNISLVENLLNLGASINTVDKNGNTALHLSLMNVDANMSITLMSRSENLEMANHLGQRPIHLASLDQENMRVLKKLLNLGISANHLTLDGQTALLYACGQQNFKACELLLPRTKLLNQKDTAEKSAFDYAFMANQYFLVEKFLGRGVNLETLDAQGNTYLLRAIENQFLSIAKMLIQKGLQLSHPNHQGITPLMRVIQYGNEGLFDLLLRKNVNLNVSDTSGRQALYYAIYYNQQTLVRKLLRNGVDLSYKDSQGNDYLMLAISVGSEDLVLEFFDTEEIGDFLDRFNHDRNSALHLAAEKNWLNVVAKLIDYGANIFVKNYKGERPVDLASNSAVQNILENKRKSLEAELHLAASSNDLFNVQRLLSFGVDVNAADEKFGETALMKALKTDSLEVVRSLLQTAANIYLTNYNGQQALDLAVSPSAQDLILQKKRTHEKILFSVITHGQLDKVRAWLNYGVDIEALHPESGVTVVMQAVLSEQADVLKYLIKQGAETHIKDIHNMTAYDYAKQVGNEEILTILMVEMENHFNHLMKAIFQGTKSDILYWVKRTYDLNKENNKGMTPLMMAAKFQDLSIVKMLVSYGANIHFMTFDSRNVLMAAAKSGRNFIVQYLLNQGALAYLIDRDGKLPIHYAVESGDSETIEILDFEMQRLLGLSFQAAQVDDVKTLRLLSNVYKSQINELNSSGKSLLIVASQSGNLDVVKFLMGELGAAVEVEGSDGLSAYTWALQNGHQQVVDYLLPYRLVLHKKLMKAIYSGTQERIKLLARQVPNFLWTDDSGRNFLMHAVLSERLKVVQYFLQGDVFDINAQDNNGKTALMMASSKSLLSIVKALIKAGSNMLSTDHNGKTARYYATSDDVMIFFMSEIQNYSALLFQYAREGSMKEISFLLGEGMNIDAQDDNGQTALMMAITFGQTKLAKFLIKNGTSLTLQNNEGKTASDVAHDYQETEILGFIQYFLKTVEEKVVYHILETGSLPAISELIELHNDTFNLNYKDSLDNSFLMMAASVGNAEIVRYFKKLGLSIGEVNKQGYMAALLAYDDGNEDLASELLGTEEEMKSYFLYLLSDSQFAGPLKLMLKMGYDPNEKDISGLPFLFSVVENNNLDFVSILVNAGASIYAQNHEGKSVIEFAKESGKETIYEFLVLQHQSNVESLMLVCESGQLEEVKKILESGLSVDTVDSQNRSCLMNATRGNQLLVVEYLLEKKAYLFYKDEEGDTAKDIAEENDFSDIVMSLELAIDALQTAFFEAAMGGDVSSLESSIQKGANIDKKSAGGYSALMMAIENNHPKVVQVLLDAGVDLSLTNDLGQTAKDIAEENGLEDLVDLIAEYEE